MGIPMSWMKKLLLILVKQIEILRNVFYLIFSQILLLNHANQRKPLKGGSPKLEYFGPKDYVPESPYIIQGGNLSPGIFSHKHQTSDLSGLLPQKKTIFEKLEPKPRRLFK